MNTTPPAQLDGANVLCYAVLNEKQGKRETLPPEWLLSQAVPSQEQPNAETPVFISHYIDGEPMPKPYALAICRYEEEKSPSVYLFYCNNKWEVMQDDHLLDLNDALKQASVQYEGIECE